MDSSVRLEVGDEIEEHGCECCGRSILSGRGSVTYGGDEPARYWFDMHRKAEDRTARLLVVLEAPRPRLRPRQPVSFVVHARLAPGGLAFSLSDRTSGPVLPDRRVTGRTLSRRQALKSSQLPTLWRIVDVIVERDPALAAFLAESGA